MTAQPIPKSLASPGLLAFVATAKFVDALPLYRQVKQFERIGVNLSRSTLASWMVRCAALAQPLINVLRDELHASGYVHMDETTLQVLKEPGKWTLLTKVETSCDRILIAGGANVEAAWEQGPAV